MTHPDPEVVIERGRDAERLLENPTFVAVMNDLSNWHVAAMIASPPGSSGGEVREHHHRMTFALREIEETLKGYRDAAAELLRNAEEDRDHRPALDATDIEDSL